MGVFVGTALPAGTGVFVGTALPAGIGVFVGTALLAGMGVFVGGVSVGVRVGGSAVGTSVISVSGAARTGPARLGNSTMSISVMPTVNRTTREIIIPLSLYSLHHRLVLIVGPVSLVVFENSTIPTSSVGSSHSGLMQSRVIAGQPPPLNLLSLSGHIFTHIFCSAKTGEGKRAYEAS